MALLPLFQLRTRGLGYEDREREIDLDPRDSILPPAWVRPYKGNGFALVATKEKCYAKTSSFYVIQICSLHLTDHRYCPTFHGQSASLTPSCLRAKRGMTDGMVPCPLVVHQGVSHFGITRLSKSLQVSSFIESGWIWLHQVLQAIWREHVCI